ncbi:hypothetical protein FOA24_13955 [Bacillus thuringiensis]|uniref:AimR family lysis-lysogeny pheromone receptor n=1 Tax=Bacillus thuringiensis TaxID=1428 RepID=UPI0033374D3B
MGILHQTFDMQLKNEGKSWTAFSKECGVSASSACEWGTEGKEISAFSFSKMAYKIFPDDVEAFEDVCIYLMSTYTKEYLLNVKKLFIIAYQNGYTEILDYIVNLCANHDNRVMRNYSKIFSLFCERLYKTKPINEIYLEIDYLRKPALSQEAEFTVLCDVLRLLILGDNGNFKVFEYHMNRALNTLNLLKQKESISLYNFWITDLYSYSILRRGKIEEFKQLNDSLHNYEYLEFFPVMRASLISRKGESLIFDSYERALENMEKALRICIERKCHFKKNVILNNINFLKLYWNCNIDTIDYRKLHIAEKSFYWYRKGDKIKALTIINRLEKEGPLTPIQLCYKGMIINDIEIIKSAIDEFKSNNEFYFVQFAIEMLNLCEKKMKIGG